MPRVTDEYREARREEILRAAAACFSERGFRATHMRDVARRAGLSTGAVYRYFPGKEELFKAMLEWQRPAELSFRAAFLEGDSAIGRLEGLVERIAKRASMSEVQVRQNFRDYGEAAEVPFLEEELGLGLNDIIGVLEAIVREAQEDGDIDRDLDPQAVAMAIGTQTVSLGFAWLFGGAYDTEAVAVTLRRMLDGLRPRG